MFSEGRKNSSYILVLLLLSVIPIAMFVVIAYLHTLKMAEMALTRITATAVQRTDTMLEDAERILRRLAYDTDLSPSAETIRHFARAQYVDVRFREFGLIDADGCLVATNFGPVEPPLPIPEHLRSDPKVPSLQVLGVHQTYVMGERSIILSLPLGGKSELNVLVDPVVLLGFIGETELDPAGYAAFVGPDGKVLAKLGHPTLRDEKLLPGDEDDVLRVSRTTNHGSITVIVEVTRDWVLRAWWRQLAMVAPIAVLCNGLLIALLLRKFRRVDLDHDLRGGLQRGELSVHYQPVVDLRSGRWVGAESLLRWRHPRHGLLLPGVFIPLAEKTGAMPELTRWLLCRAAAETHALRSREPDFLLFVNVPPSQLQGGSPEPLAGTVAECGLDPGRTVLEITEASLWDVPENDVRSTMTALRFEGLAFALDDFGNGSFSLQNIVEMEFRFLKIDKSFVRAINRDPRRVFVLDGLIDLARKLHLEVIAEGIEHDDQREYLLARGVVWGQGWLFSPAVPIADLERRRAGERAGAAAAG